MSFRRLVCVVGMVALGPGCVLPAFAWDPTPEGYAQFRYEYKDSEDDGDFDTRRVRLSWRDTVNDRGTTARIQFDVGDLFTGGGHEIDLKDAWVSHPFGNGWSTRVGYGDAEFGLDVPYSSSKRLPFERAKATREFLPGEKTLGVLFTWEGQEESTVVVDLQVTDGMDAWSSDDDDAESLIARVQVPLEDSIVGVSYMTSSREGDDYSVEPDLWGAHVRWEGETAGSNWAFQGEYFDGELFDGMMYDADGWYGLVEFSPQASDATVFYRYDELDASAQETAWSYERHTLGVAWDWMENNRLTFQVEDIDNADSETNWGLQWQVKYK
ncbi:MAG: porin [Armatimonadota bacterium]